MATPRKSQAQPDKPVTEFNLNTWRPKNKVPPKPLRVGKERILLLSPEECDIFEYAEAMNRMQYDEAQGAVALLTTVVPKDKRDIVFANGMPAGAAMDFVKEYNEHYGVDVSPGERDGS